MCSRWLGGVCISALCVCVCVWDSLVWVWGSECAAGGFVVFVYRHCVCVCSACVCGTFFCGFGGVSVQEVALLCLYIGIVCAVCGTVWCGFGGVSVQQVALWCLNIGIE